MIFTNYADFRNDVHTLLDGDDISTSDLSVSVLDLIISAGEQRIYRELRSSTQDTALSLTITANVATLPSDFLELRGSPYVAGFIPTVYMPWEQLQALIQTSAAQSHAIYYTFQNDTMIFSPIQATGVQVTGRYYKRFADISTGLNAFFTRHPDLFIYAALAESGTFMGEMSRLSAWETKYVSLVSAANEQERRRVTRGSKLQTRVA